MWDLTTYFWPFFQSFNLNPKNSEYRFLRFTILDFSGLISKPSLSSSHCFVAANIFSAVFLSLQSNLKSSAYLTINTSFKLPLLNNSYFLVGFLYEWWVLWFSHWLAIHQSNSLRTTLDNNGLRIPPCGTPFCGTPIPLISVFSILDIIHNNCLSWIPRLHNCFMSFPWLTLSKNPLISISTTYWKLCRLVSANTLAMAWWVLRFGRKP